MAIRLSDVPDAPRPIRLSDVPDSVPRLYRQQSMADPSDIAPPAYHEPTLKARTEPAPEAPRPGLARRLASDVWNAGPASIIKHLRTGTELGKAFRDVEILKQFQLARERGEPTPSPEEVNKRADAAIAARNQKSFLVGGAAGQVLAGNQIPLPPAKTLPEKAVDIAGGVGGAIANIGLTRRILPTAPEPLVWEAATEAAGGTPGTGAAMAGIMGAAGKIVGKSLPAEGIGKRVLRRAKKTGLAATGVGGLTAAEGGSPEEIATSMLTIVAFDALGAVKELPREARRKALADLVHRVAEAEKTIPKEAVSAAEKLIDSGAYDTTATSSVGAEAGPTFKPRVRAEAGLGREIAPAAASNASQKTTAVSDTTPPAQRIRIEKQPPSGLTRTQYENWLYTRGSPSGRAKSLSFEDQWQYYQENHLNPPTGVSSMGTAPTTVSDVSQKTAVVSDNAPPAEPPAPVAPAGTISNAKVAADRAALGLSPVPKRAAQSEAEWAQKAKDEGLDNPLVAVDRAKQVIENPRPLTESESAGFGMVIEKAKADYRRAEKLTAELPDSDPRFAEAVKQGQLARDLYDHISKATEVAGSPQGGALRARQMVVDALTDNTSVPSVLSRARIEKGRNLTPAEETKATETVHELADATAKADKVQRIASKRQAGKILRSGRRGSRYDRMSEAEKDAELQGLLQEAGDTPEAAALYNMAMNLGSRPGIRTIGDIAARLQEHFPAMNEFSLSDAMVEAMAQKVRVTSQTEQVLKMIRKEGRGNKNLRTLIDDILGRSKNGEAPEDTRTPRAPETDTIQALKAVRDFYTKELENSEPVQQAKMQRRLDFLNARIANRDFLPKTKQVAYEPSRRVLEMQYEASRLDNEVRRQISQRKPWSWPDRLSEPLRIIMALKSSFDLSGLGNQGGWALLSHPLRTLRRMPEALNAFTSEKDAWITNEKIRKRANAGLYFRDKLELVEATGHAAFTHGEEQYRSSLAEYIPGVKGSNRSFATLLNLIRADSYDSLAQSFAGVGGPTRVEGLAIADFVNMMTGRGNVRGYEKNIAAVNGLFWAPRRVISRFQTLTTLGGMIEWGRPSHPGQREWSPVHLRGTGTTRKLFAGEIGRYMAGLATVYTLGALAGGELEGDPRSTEFGKIKFGNTRIDPLSGLSQTMVFLSRMAARSTKTAEGEIVPLVGEDLPYTARSLGDVGQDFLSGKLTPGLGIGWSILTGNTRFDGPATPGTVLKGALAPIGFEDIYKVMVDQGVSRGTALSMLGLLGVGVQVYGDELTRAEYKEYYK